VSVPADLRRAADSIDGIVTKALGRVALDAKRQFLDAGRRASGGDLRLSGSGRKGHQDQCPVLVRQGLRGAGR
jgi:hypothetical protein